MWAPDEHTRFLQALHQHVLDNGWSGMEDAAGRLRVGLGRGTAQKIAEAVGTRNEAQVRSHAQKYFQKVWRRGG